MGHCLEVVRDEASFKALGCQVILVAGDNASYGHDWMERYVNIEDVYTIDLFVRDSAIWNKNSSYYYILVKYPIITKYSYN